MTSGDHQRNKREAVRPPSHRPPEHEAGTEASGLGSGLTKLLFTFTRRHRGKALELDSRHDTMRVLGPTGEELAAVNSEVVLDHLLGCAQAASPPAGPGEARPPSPFRVSARADDGGEYEGRCPALGRSGIFLELTTPPPPGTRLDMTIVNADDVSRVLRIEGTVAWTCRRPDEFGFGPGVGVTCTRRAPDSTTSVSGAGRPAGH